MKLKILLVVALAITFIGCQGGGGSSLPQGCQPLLSGQDCLLPYPSDFFRVADPSTPSGGRIVLSGAARLTATGGVNGDISDTMALDGFSRTPPMIAAFPTAVATTGLTSVLDDPGKSLLAASPTVVLEVPTGRRIPHFVDLDRRDKDPAHWAFVIRPVVPLSTRTRYIVAIRGLLQPGGAPVPAPAGFQALRDGNSSGTLAAHFEQDVFPALTAAGIDRSSLQLAWDFTTRSEESLTTDLLTVRAKTLAWLAANTPTVTITSVVSGPDPAVWRTIQGTFSAPLFLTSAGSYELSRGTDGLPALNGTTTIDFLAQIPMTLQTSFGPGRALAYGHGFFGTKAEIQGSSPIGISSSLQSPLFAIDWEGMSQPDTSFVASSFSSSPAHALQFTDRVHQGFANWLVYTSVIKHGLSTLPAFARPASGPGTSIGPGGVSNAGQPLFDPSQVYFLGISMGHLLGGTLAALDPDLTRITLEVGGAGWSHVFYRSAPFGLLLGIIKSAFPTPLEDEKFIATVQDGLDRIDTATYAHYAMADPLPGAPADRRILLQIGMGDVGVPNYASWMHARALGLTELLPTDEVVYGLQTSSTPVSGSALEVYDFGVDLSVYANPTPDSLTLSNPVHEGVRKLAAAKAQMSAFFQTSGSMAIHECPGPCNPD